MYSGFSALCMNGRVILFFLMHLNEYCAARPAHSVYGIKHSQYIRQTGQIEPGMFLSPRQSALSVLRKVLLI